MRWELHTADHLRAAHGNDILRGYAERLKAVLDQNGRGVPRFPGMAWTDERLPGGEGVAVGVAQDGVSLIAYVWPADRIEFQSMEAVTLLYQEAGAAGTASVLLRWYAPPDD